MSIILAGVSHHNTPLSIRERLYFPEGNMGEWLDRLAGYNGLEEQGLDAIHRFFLESRDIGREELDAHLYVHREAEATRHLFTVASSLDSMVVGEPQILGQVKEAYRVAQASGHAGKALTNLFSRAFRVAKKIREQTPIGESPVSVSSVAVDLAKRIFGSLAGKNVLLLGAGEMGEAAARHLKASGAERARHQERAATLKAMLTDAGLPLMPSETHIVPVLVGDPVKCKRVTDMLLEAHGIYIQPINYPTVPRGTERLRITPSPVHTDAMMGALLAALITVWTQLELPRAA